MYYLPVEEVLVVEVLVLEEEEEQEAMMVTLTIKVVVVVVVLVVVGMDLVIWEVVAIPILWLVAAATTATTVATSVATSIVAVLQGGVVKTLICIYIQVYLVINCQLFRILLVNNIVLVEIRP